ncbi:MAG: hypothetical protein HN348_12525 [Proteobacteria bacterium]|jgi:hypothetical protein|nr:hypothetical protein [Pseudomonadota bacterium]
MIYLFMIFAFPSCIFHKEAQEEEVVDDDFPMVEQCVTYLDCMMEVSPSSVSVLLETYGSEGECWLSESNSAYCEEACQKGLEEMFELYPLAESCGGGLEKLFDLDVVYEAIVGDTETHLVINNECGSALKELLGIDDTPYYQEYDILDVAELSKLKEGEAIHIVGLPIGWLGVHYQTREGWGYEHIDLDDDPMLVTLIWRDGNR